MLETKSFNQKLAAFVRSQKTQRDNLQVLLQSGFEQATQHGQLSQLSAVLNETIGVRSINTVVLKEYIQAHANVKWSKGKDKKMRFEKAEKTLTVVMPDVPWYEHSSAVKNQAKADMDVLARARTLLTTLSKSMKEGGIKEGQEEKAQELQSALAKLLA